MVPTFSYACSISHCRRNHATISSASATIIYVGEAVSFTLNRRHSFEVRDYYGTLVSSGTTTSSGLQIAIPDVTAPGWYKLYVYGAVDQGAPWAKVVGGTTFVIFRNTPNFPARPADPRAVGAVDVAGDQIIRGLTGMGPQRHKVADAAKPAEAIAKLEHDIGLDELYYTPFDPIRKRELLVNFPNGVSKVVNNVREVDPVKIEGLKQIVTHFKDRVHYWEGKNEPNIDRTPADAAQTEQTPFYDAVKSVSPELKVLGPAPVNVKSNNIQWLRTFMGLAGTKFDAFSYHAYNMANGDLGLIRRSQADVQSLLDEFGLGGIEKWQTEQGYFAAVYGSYQPRLQGRWTMLQMMAYEQYGIPKEHNHVWYDRSHGFWDIPAFYVNDDWSLNPAAPLMRVWSEELYGTTFSKAYSFGAEEKMYIGSLFTGPGKAVAAFQSAGSPYGSLKLAVTGGTSVKTVSPFGDETTLPITNGVVQLPVSELPVYVQLATGQTCEVVPRTYGENVARRNGVSLTFDGAADPLLSRTVNGELENLYHTYNDADGAWKVYPTSWPAIVEVALPEAETISDAVIYAAVPWQAFATLVDYELQYWSGTSWVTLEHVTEPTKTYRVYSPPVRCTMENFFSDRCIFEHHFAPVTTNKLRLVVHAASYGGGPTAEVHTVGAQADSRMSVNLREIEIFKAVGADPIITAQPQSISPALGATASPECGRRYGPTAGAVRVAPLMGPSSQGPTGRRFRSRACRWMTKGSTL
jgi:hypothetical protein